MTRSAVALRQDWPDVSVEVNANEDTVAQELRELLEHLHFMLPPRLQIPLLQRAFGKRSERDRTQNHSREAYLLESFLGRYLESPHHRKTQARMMARIYACAAHIEDTIKKSHTTCSISDIRNCERLTKACEGHGIERFAFTRPPQPGQPLRLRAAEIFSSLAPTAA